MDYTFKGMVENRANCGTLDLRAGVLETKVKTLEGLGEEHSEHATQANQRTQWLESKAAELQLANLKLTQDPQLRSLLERERVAMARAETEKELVPLFKEDADALLADKALFAAPERDVLQYCVTQVARVTELEGQVAHLSSTVKTLMEELAFVLNRERAARAREAEQHKAAKVKAEEAYLAEKTRKEKERDQAIGAA